MIGFRCKCGNTFSREVLIRWFLLGILKITILFFYFTCYLFFTALKFNPACRQASWIFCVGTLSKGSHLFSFRIQKLSLLEPMILFMGKVGRCQHKKFNKPFLEPMHEGAHFIVYRKVGRCQHKKFKLNFRAVSVSLADRRWGDFFMYKIKIKPAVFYRWFYFFNFVIM